MSIQHPKYLPFRPENNDYSGSEILDIHDPNFAYKNTSYSSKDDVIDDCIQALENIIHDEKPYYTVTKFWCPFCRQQCKGSYDLQEHMAFCKIEKGNIPKLELKVRHLDEYILRSAQRREELDQLLKEIKDEGTLYDDPRKNRLYRRIRNACPDSRNY